MKRAADAHIRKFIILDIEGGVPTPSRSSRRPTLSAGRDNQFFGPDSRSNRHSAGHGHDGLVGRHGGMSRQRGMAAMDSMVRRQATIRS